MNAAFKKMQFKGHSPICVLEAPESFLPNLEEMQEFTEVHTDLAPGTTYAYLVGFVKSVAELEVMSGRVANAIAEDQMFWIAYPKKSSKKYKTDISRDHGWESIGELGYEPVRLIAIDADWSCMRLRKAEHIKSMTRRNSMALSEKGKERTKGNSGK